MFSTSRWLHLARYVYANLPFSYPTKAKIREVMSPILHVLMSGKSGLALISELKNSMMFRSNSLAWEGSGEQAFAQLLKELATHCNTYGPIGNIITLPFMSLGGAEMVALNFSRAFRELQPDYAVLIVITDRPLKSDQLVLPPGVKVVALDDYVPPNADAATHRLQFLKSLVQTVKPSIFHNINSELAWKLIIDEGPLISKITRVFASIFAFQYLPGTKHKTGYAAYFLQPALPHLHGLLSDNQRFIADAIAEYSLDAASRAKLHVVYNPCRLLNDNVSNDHQGLLHPRNYNVIDGRLQILWAGRLDAEKRVDLLCDIAKNCPFADFLMFGHCVVDKDSTVSALPNLIFKGGFSDPRDLVIDRSFDAFIFTSRWEGLPNILIEVGALGIPIIAPVVGGVGELISDATGYPLPEEPTVQDYEQALKLIKADPSTAATRARALKNLVQTRHSWGAFTESAKAIPDYMCADFRRNKRAHSSFQVGSPTVSIVIPFYNQVQFLYTSVSSALLAYRGELEIIIVDDGSTDPRTDRYLGEVAALSEKVRIVRQANQGLSGARNTGIEIAKGRFIQLLDADDILVPGKLDTQVAHMAVSDELNVSVCNFLLSDETATHITKSDEAIARFALTLEDFLYRWERGFAIPIHCALFRKEIFAQTKFDVSMRAKEDWLFWCTLAFKGCRMAYLHGHYAIYRQHSNSMRRSYVGMGKSWLDAAQKIDTLLAGQEPLFLKSAVSWFEQYYYKHPEYRQEITRLQTKPLPVGLCPQTEQKNDVARLLERLSFLSAKSAMPLITVVIPVYNHYKHLEECLLSLSEQGTQDFEVICIDDASPDPRIGKLMQALQDKLTRLRIITHTQNQGISASQNQAVSLAVGDFIAFLDCDDLLPPNALACVNKEIAQQPDTDYFFSDRWDIDESGRILRLAKYGGYYHLSPTSVHSLRDNLVDGMVASHLKVIRRRIYLQVNGCSNEFEGIQDWDLALKISEIGKLVYIPEPLYKHRIHSRSITQLAKTDQLRKTNILRRRYIERWIRPKNLSGPDVDPNAIRVFNCDEALPSIAELKKCHSLGQYCVMDLRSSMMTSSINFIREFNSYFDLILWDRPQVAVTLIGYLWGDVLSPPKEIPKLEVNRAAPYLKAKTG